MKNIFSLKLFSDDISAVAQGAIFKQQCGVDADKICSECANTLKSIVTNEDTVIALTTSSSNTTYLAAVIKYCEKNSIDLVLFNDKGPRILVKATN